MQGYNSFTINAPPLITARGSVAPISPDRTPQWLSSSMKHATVSPDPSTRAIIYGNGANEPSAWYANGLWNCIFLNSVVQYYTSCAGDPMIPANWSTPVVVIGGNNGGWAGRAMENFLYIEGSTLYLFWIDGITYDVRVSTADISAPTVWTTSPNIIISGAAGTIRNANMGVGKQGALYYMLIEIDFGWHRANMFNYSNVLTGANSSFYLDTGITPVQNAVGYDFVATAWTLTAAATISRIYYSISALYQTPGIVTSIEAKAGTGSWLYIENDDAGGSNARITSFNLATGAIGTVNHNVGSSANTQSHAVMTPLGHGWYRCSVYNSGANCDSAAFGSAHADAVRTTVAGETILLRNAQCEALVSAFKPTRYVNTPRYSPGTGCAVFSSPSLTDASWTLVNYQTNSLLPGPDGVAASGLWLGLDDDGVTWTAMYNSAECVGLGGYPNKIYRAINTDLAQDTWEVVSPSGTIADAASATIAFPIMTCAHHLEVDQVADPYPAWGPHGVGYLFYSVCDNRSLDFYLGITPLEPILKNWNGSNWVGSGQNTITLNDNYYSPWTIICHAGDLPAGAPAGTPRPVGTWLLDTTTAGMINNARSYNSSAAQNDQVNFDVILHPGTWRLDALFQTGAAQGIVTVTLDGLPVVIPGPGISCGLLDTYSAGTVYNVAFNIPTIIVQGSTTYRRRLSFTMYTKNAASSGYNLGWHQWTLSRVDV